MLYPMARGTLAGNQFVKTKPLDKGAAFDYKPHFPAGDKRSIAGAGKRYQKKVGGKFYTTFSPMQPGFNWRADVCGDTFTGPTAGDHMKGGKYYDNGKIVDTFKSGSTIDIQMAVIAHHKGYIEAHVCDIDKKHCPTGDLTTKCFTESNCVQLQRAPNKICDSGLSTKCGPIDKNHTGRWYLPCATGLRVDLYGQNKEISYVIPPSFKCEHCVLHWAWISGNACHAEGVTEYFFGPNRPRKWETCSNRRGKAFAVRRKPCGAYFSEEYYQCADIRIE